MNVALAVVWDAFQELSGAAEGDLDLEEDEEGNGEEGNEEGDNSKEGPSAAGGANSNKVAPESDAGAGNVMTRRPRLGLANSSS